MEKTHFESLYPEDSREEEIGKILSFIKSGNSVQIVGLPGIGRSNLLHLLSYNHNVREKHLGENQKWFHFVYLDCSEMRDKEYSHLLKFALLSIQDSLRERQMEEEENKIKEIISQAQSEDELVLSQALKKTVDYLSIEKELTLILSFDRFEEYLEKPSKEFFSLLRVLRNRAKYRFSCIFSLSRPLDELLEPQVFSDFYEFVTENIVYLSIYDEPGLKFRISYLEKVSGKKIDSNVLEEITRLTGGHGKLTRLSAEAIQTSEHRRENKDLVEFLLSQKSVRGSLFEIWANLTPSEQKAISTTQYSLLSTHYLEDVGLLKEAKGTPYGPQITIPLFEKFIKSLPKEEEKISYNPAKNEILKGSLVISENLSALEFKLLKFLIENKEKTLSREEIIHGVWKDQTSQEGVTDQALDQLIFRLRKKIEEEPNSPKHLITLKGQGLKFTP